MASGGRRNGRSSDSRCVQMGQNTPGITLPESPGVLGFLLSWAGSRPRPALALLDRQSELLNLSSDE